MSGKGRVSDELAARVRAVAAELDYRPSFAAQSLARGATGMVGMVVPNLANPYFYDVIKSINLAAAASGYQVAVADANEDAAAEVELCRSFVSKLDGLLLMSPRMALDDLRALSASTDNLVLVNRVAPEVGVPTISIDSYQGMLDVCAHLLGLGHRSAVHLSGPDSSWSNAERTRAVDQAQAFGLRVSEIRAGGTIRAGYDTVEQALASSATALICHNDLVALGAMSRLAELGIRVPDELSVTGFDDIAFAGYGSPALTTVGIDGDVGQNAWSLLQDLMEGGVAPAMRLIPAAVVIRDSTGAPRPSPAPLR